MFHFLASLEIQQFYLSTCTNVSGNSAIHWNKLMLLYYSMYTEHVLQLAYIQNASPKHLIYGSFFGVQLFSEKY